MDRPVGFPAASVGITNSGRLAVVADPSTPAHLVGHALDYADRLAELIPLQLDRRQAPLQPGGGRHRAAPAPWKARHLVLIVLVAMYTVISCAGPGIGVGVGG